MTLIWFVGFQLGGPFMPNYRIVSVEAADILISASSVPPEEMISRSSEDYLIPVACSYSKDMTT